MHDDKNDKDPWHRIGYRIGRLIGEAAERGTPDSEGARSALEGLKAGLCARGSEASLRVLDQVKVWTLSDILGMREHVQ